MIETVFDIDGEAEVRRYLPEEAQMLFDAVESERDRLRRRLAFVDPTTGVEKTLEFITRSRASETDLDGFGIWVAGEFAGGIGMSVVPLMNWGEIGYWLLERFEGRGLITRACRAMTDFAFREMKLHRVALCADPGNRRSRAVAERLGFVQEGVLREAAQTGLGYHDVVYYAILDREWPAAQS